MNFQQLRDDHLLIQHEVTFYPYQEEISNRIINALLQNLRLTADATPEEVRKLKQVEIPIEISRQAGKTTAIVHTVEVIMVFLSEFFKRPVQLAIFAPQLDQARTDFERLKNALRPIKDLIIQDDETKQRVKERENAKTLVLPNGSSCFIAPVTTTSKPESPTLDLMIFEEAQDMEDKIIKESIFPMGASTNAPRILIGTAGTRLCYYRTLGLNSEGAIKIYFEEVVKQRKETYDKTGDARHLIYENTVRQEIERFGLESDEIQRPYFGKWLIGTGQFTTEEDVDALIELDRAWTHSDLHSECYAGIDTAKHPDQTVVTILRFNKDKKKKEIINWLTLSGENYQNQFDIITDYLKRYNILALAIDATGQGDFMPDLFEINTEWRDENSGLYRVKFGAVSKDQMYKNLKVSIKELLTTLPNLDIKSGREFRQQLLDLQQEYKGQLLSVKHPDSPNAHDDYPDSWALAEWAFAKFNENKASIGFIDYGTRQEQSTDQPIEDRDSEFDKENHWPNLEDNF